MDDHTTHRTATPTPTEATVATRDGAQLHVIDGGGGGQPILLLHAWGLDSDMWAHQLPALGAAGLRPVTFDRRGHGRSGTGSAGFSLDTLAADVACVIRTLDLDDVVLVGHSTGGLEAVAAAAGLAAGRVDRVVLSASMTPCVTAGPDNPDGAPAEYFAATRAAMRADLAAWIEENTAGYWGTAPETEPAADTTWTQQRLASTPLDVLLATHETATGSDVRRELAAIDRPVLVLHGDADRSAPLEITGRPSAALARRGTLEVVPGAGHGLYASCATTYNARLLAFVVGV